jgi:hypothetical protein
MYNEAPILCVEFDGLQDGYNVGQIYVPSPKSVPQNPWRQTITELKLKVAHCSLFPFFVVGTKHFEDISDEIRMTIVDGIIGEVLSSMETRKKFEEGFDPTEIGYTQEQFDKLPPYDQHEIIQDWVISVEVESDFKNNPICVKRGELDNLLRVKSFGYEHKFIPDIEDIEDVIERARGIDNATMIGANVTLHTDDFGDVTGEVWLPRFRVPFYSDFGLSQDIAAIFALSKLMKLRHAITG